MACYILTENEIRRLYRRQLTPAKALSFNNAAVFAYTGADVREHAGTKRALARDVVDMVADRCADSSNMGECFYEAVQDTCGDLNKLEELDQ